MFKIFKPNKRRWQSKQNPSSMPHRTCYFDFAEPSKSKQKQSMQINLPFSAANSQTSRMFNSTTSRTGNLNNSLNSKNIYAILKQSVEDKTKIYTSQKSLRKKQLFNREDFLSSSNSTRNLTNIKKNSFLKSCRNNKTMVQWGKLMLDEKESQSMRQNKKSCDRNLAKSNRKNQIKSNLLNRESVNSHKSDLQSSLAQTGKLEYCTIKILLQQKDENRQISVKYRVKKIGLLIQFLKNYLKQQIHQSNQKNKLTQRFNRILSQKQIVSFQTIDYNLQVDYYLTLSEQDGSFLNGETLTLRPLYKSPQAQITLNSFEIIQCIGNGGFSTVFLCRFKQNYKFYAMKIIDKEFIVKNQKKKIIMNQRNIMIELRDGIGLAKLFYSFQSKEKLVFVMEYYQGGELFNLVKRFRKMDENVARFYITQVLIGLEQIHDHNIVYRDFKPENIMVDIDGHVCIADFGLAKPNISTSNDRAYSFCGSPQYMPPEMILKDGHSLPVDFYCLGALLYELVTGLPPFYNTNPDNIYQATLTQQLTFPDHVDLSRELQDLLLSLLCKDQTYRLGSTFGVQEVLSHPWFKSIKKSDFILKKVQTPINFKRIQDLRFNIDQMHEQNQRQMKQILKSQKNELTSKYLKIMNGFYYDYRLDQSSQQKQNQFKDFKKQKNRLSIQKNKNNSSSLALTNCTKRSQNSLILGNKQDQNLKVFIKAGMRNKQTSQPFKANLFSKQTKSSRQIKGLEKRLLKNLSNFEI